MTKDVKLADVVRTVGCWMACSVGMMVCNKLAITVFPLPCLLVAMQFGFGALVMLIGCWRWLHIGSLQDVLRWCMVLPFFCGMMLTSLLALRGASITTVVVFRSLSPLLAVTVERCFPNPVEITSSMVMALVGLLVGALVYAQGTQNTEYVGIAWTALNVTLAVGDRLLQRLMLSEDQSPVDISKSGVTFLNNAIGLIPMLVAAACRREYAQLPRVLNILSPYSVVVIFASCVMGVGISFLGVHAQSMISATSFLVLVNANTFVIMLLGPVALHEPPEDAYQIVGAVIVVLSCIKYGLCRQRSQEEPSSVSPDAMCNIPEKTPLLHDGRMKLSAGPLTDDGDVSTFIQR